MERILEHLEHRINGLANGLFFEPCASNSPDCSLKQTTLTYDVVFNGITYSVKYGVDQELYYSQNAEASLIASLVGYGWELLALGAQLVVVKGWWGEWVCWDKPYTDLDSLRKALYYLSERVSCVGSTNRALERICVYAIGTGFDGVVLDYAPPERRSSRNAYLANLGKSVSLLLNVPVQFGLKPVLGRAVVCRFN